MAAPGHSSPPIRPSLLGTKLPPVIGIFITVFLDLLSFGIFIPDLQLRARELHLVGIGLGAMLGAYSLAQLITGPILGRISDMKSRRQVLLITSFLATISYFLYGHGQSLPMLILSRTICGVAAASLGVAFAYMADITSPEERSKGLGIIGAAFGLGFIIGPVLGALMLYLGHDDPFYLSMLGAAMSFLNFVYILLFLPDPIPQAPEAAAQRDRNPIRLVWSAVKRPELTLLLTMFFAVQFGFTNLESTFFQLLADPRGIFHLDSESAKFLGAKVLATVGILQVINQGFLVRVLTPKYGEVKLLRFAYLALGPALAAVPFFNIWWPGILVIFLMAIGSGLAQPSISSLISRNSPRDMQGGIFGVTQSLGSMARLVAPLVSNTLFQVHPSYPYLFGGAIFLIPISGAWKLKQPSLPMEGEVVAAH